MSSPELFKLAESALRLPAPADLLEKLLDLSLSESHAKSSELLQQGQCISRRRKKDPSEEGGKGSPQVFPFRIQDEEWILKLEGGRELDEDFLSGARIVLQAISLQEALKRARFDTRFHLWELEVIRSIAANIKHLDEPEKLAGELLDHLIALLGVRRAQVYLGEDEAPAAGFGETVLDSAEKARARTKPLIEETRMAVPLGSSENLGLLVLAEKEARSGIESFAEEDRRLVELFALQMTVALEYAAFARKSLERDRLERELQVAATIQRHILPQSPPQMPHFGIIARSTPCLHVAGDTYDTITCGEDLVIAITDVSGKGVGAGLIASGIHAGIRLLLGEELYLSDLASRLNTYLCGATDDNRFATFAMARISKTGRLFAVNAGHCPILVRRGGHEIRQIPSSGLPLGIMDIGGYRSEDMQLGDGDLVLFYTDGFTEAENPQGEEFGLSRVIKTLERVRGGAQEAADALFDAIHAYTQGQPLADDATLIAVDFRPE